MASLEDALTQIARDRKKDPLAPVTVVMPSHAAAIQARRRLVELGPFAGVRFETLPRLAELIGGADLARSGRSPLARPIGDYAASLVAREGGEKVAAVRDLPGFARALRQTFRRLRRGGIQRPEDARADFGSGLLPEVIRLHGSFRAQTAAFYDDEDLLDTASVTLADHPPAVEFGAIYVVPPGALTAASDHFLRSLGRHTRVRKLDESASQPVSRFVLAPDPATEAREAAREVLVALDSGVPLHEVAVFHGADRSYRSLLNQALEDAGVPITPMPGTPLTETAAGRGVLALAELPGLEYARTAVLDFLSLAPLNERLPAADGEVFALPSAWRRVAREAGVSKGATRWDSGLGLLISELDTVLHDPAADVSEARRAAYERSLVNATDLRNFITGLVQRLEPLREPQRAQTFITAFKDVVRQYVKTDAEGMERVLGEVDQLGTVDALGGTFTLEGFATSLRANLDIAHLRDKDRGQLGKGVLVGDYRLAAGMRFKHVVLSGAYEGVFPAGAGIETLIEDGTWSVLRRHHPFVEDAALRLEQAQAAAQRAIAAAGESIVWTAPRQAANAGRDYYPSALMINAAKEHNAALAGASELRDAPASDWLRKPPSPLQSLLYGPVLDLPELRLRDSLDQRAKGIEPQVPDLVYPLVLMRRRRSNEFTEFDTNLGGIPPEYLAPQGTVAPTSLEAFAACGRRYFLGSVLRLRAPEEPQDNEMMDSAERGSLVHRTLQRFFEAEQARGRPAPGEPWRPADRTTLLALLDEELDRVRERGRGGLDVFADHERRSLHADLTAFLDSDAAFRAETGAVPAQFETKIPETEHAGLRLSGFVDRIDLAPNGDAWVIDYKTGSARSYEKIEEDPLRDGTALQLPVYLTAVPDAPHAEAVYWFISRRGGFRRIPYTATPDVHNRFLDTLAAIEQGVKSGAFPANPGEWNDFYNSFENCTYCDFDRLCSRRRDQEAQDKAGDPALEPWQRVGRAARGETR